MKNLIVTNWTDGIYYRNAQNGSIANNNASSNNNGIHLTSSSNYNTITNNTASNNNYGIHLSSSRNNKIYNNFFNNTNNFYFYGTIYGTYWNIIKTAGTNIVGGPWIGGNYWGKPDGSGFSDTCADSDGDGICDSSYTFGTSHIDYLPLTYPAPTPTPTPIPEFPTVVLPVAVVIVFLSVLQRMQRR